MIRAVATLLVAAVAGVAACASTPAPEPTQARTIPSLDYSVVRVYPHDPTAFTQGLLFHDGFLYESTGRNGASSLRKVKLETGEVVQQRDVPDTYFAEGLALWGTRLLQLTWQTNIGFVYDLTSFAPQGTFNYTGEGWGLAADRTRLIMSDGTPQLRFLDPSTLMVTGTLTVKESGEPVRNLNELEMIGADLFANIWTTDRIVRIDLATGAVTAHLDLDRLRSQLPQGREIDVLNGIAYDGQGKRLFVTGKLWPSLFEIKVAGVP
jgi:glutaminyl-peptide cyclotransferase